MNPTELQPFELMQIAADFFESEGIHYRVVGSMASMAYGEPRFTNDVDIVAELTLDKVPALCKAFAAPDFYVSEQAVRDAVQRQFQFKIIHPSSGLKVDVIVSPTTEFTQTEKTRIKRITSEGEYSVWFGSPEDVLLNKLVYFKLGGGESQKHLRDVGGMLKLLDKNLDSDYVTCWAKKLDVHSEWELVLKRLKAPNS
jgi:hypothetical protein